MPAPHNVVVAQPAVPTPSIVPIEPAEAPALPTPDPVVPIEPAVATASFTEGAACATPTVTGTKTGSSVTTSPSVHSKPKLGHRIHDAKSSPPPAKRPAKDGRRSRCRSRSSSTSRSTSHQREKAQASINPKGVNASDSPTPNLKRGRGRGRGKIVELTNAPLIIPTVQSHIRSITKPKAGSATNGEEPTAFPAVIRHLSKLDQDAKEPLESKWNQVRLSRARPHSGISTRAPPRRL